MNFPSTLKSLLAFFIVQMFVGCGAEKSANEIRPPSESDEQESRIQTSSNDTDLDESKIGNVEIPQAEYGKAIDESKAIFVYLRLDEKKLSCSVRGLASDKIVPISVDEPQREKDLEEFFHLELKKEMGPEMIIISTGNGVKYMETHKVFSLAKDAMDAVGKELTVYLAVDDDSEK